MKRSMMFVCVALLAFAGACKKGDKKKADDKAADMKPADPAPAGDMKPADPAPAGGETKPAEGTMATGDFDPAPLCKKIEELANKEGGKALETYNARLKDDCVKEMGEEASKKGPEATKAFADCVNGAASFTAAMDTCKQFN